MDLVFQIIFTVMGAFLFVVLTKFLIQIKMEELLPSLEKSWMKERPRLPS